MCNFTRMHKPSPPQGGLCVILHKPVLHWGLHAENKGRETSPEDLRERILERQTASSFAGTRERLASVGEEKSLRRGSPRESFAPLEAGGPNEGPAPLFIGARKARAGLAGGPPAWSGGGVPLPGLAGAHLAWSGGGAPRWSGGGCTPPGLAGVHPAGLARVHPAWSGGGAPRWSCGGAPSRVRRGVLLGRALPGLPVKAGWASLPWAFPRRAVGGFLGPVCLFTARATHAHKRAHVHSTSIQRAFFDRFSCV
ncbi:hypothetical protein Taro_045565, partial [Colocasia esculenta]|nr:hypothetical protein [Colocasia esculenta]